MGKVIGSDIRECKQTVLFSYTMKQDKYKKELLKYYGKEDVTEEEINRVREIFKESGAYDYSYNYMNDLYNESISILDNIKWINSENKQLLRGFVEYLRKRNK